MSGKKIPGKPWLTLMLLLLPVSCIAASAGGSPPSVLGNALNPTGAPLADRTDERGMATFKQRVSRSPAGLIYDVPSEPAEDTTGAWHGMIDVGMLTNDGKDETVEFNEYTDWDTFISSRLPKRSRRYNCMSGPTGIEDRRNGMNS